MCVGGIDIKFFDIYKNEIQAERITIKPSETNGTAKKRLYWWQEHRSRSAYVRVLSYRFDVICFGTGCMRYARSDVFIAFRWFERVFHRLHSSNIKNQASHLDGTFFRFVFSFCLSRAAVAVYSVAMTLNVDMHGKYTRKSTNRITKMFIVFFFYLRFFERSNSWVRFFLCASAAARQARQIPYVEPLNCWGATKKIVIYLNLLQFPGELRTHIFDSRKCTYNNDCCCFIFACAAATFYLLSFCFGNTCVPIPTISITRNHHYVCESTKRTLLCCFFAFEMRNKQCKVRNPRKKLHLREQKQRKRNKFFSSSPRKKHAAPSRKTKSRQQSNGNHISVSLSRIYGNCIP